MAEKMARARACETELAAVLRRHGCVLSPAVQTVELDALEGTFGLRATFRIVPR